MTTRDLTEAAALPETPDLDGESLRLAQAQLDILQGNGERRPVRPGDVLCREGEPSPSFVVVIEGRVAMVEDYGTVGAPSGAPTGAPTGLSANSGWCGCTVRVVSWGN
ncbi:MAG TPA: hypothetical protein VGJ13_17890 [Pseudonocardiaceae bacterium]|jgi:hypothetical protein